MAMMCSVCGVGVDSSGVVWHQYGCNAVERELPLVASSPDPRDAEIARLKARAEKAETEVDAIAWERGVIEDRLTQALAACAEMRAALERMIKYAVEDRATTPGSTRLERQITRANCLLARPDLGAGMVLGEREVLERLRDVLQRLPRAGWGYTDAERAAVADLDALLKKGGG